MEFYCRKNVENESYSEFYAESHFVLTFFRKNLVKKVIKSFNFLVLADMAMTTTADAIGDGIFCLHWCGTRQLLKTLKVLY